MRDTHGFPPLLFILAGYLFGYSPSHGMRTSRSPLRLFLRVTVVGYSSFPCYAAIMPAFDIL
jgi:hypothetical protein